MIFLVSYFFFTEYYQVFVGLALMKQDFTASNSDLTDIYRVSVLTGGRFLWLLERRAGHGGADSVVGRLPRDGRAGRGLPQLLPLVHEPNPGHQTELFLPQ